MSVVVEEETAKDDSVTHTSSDLVSQFSGSGSAVGTLSGPTVIAGQGGRSPLMSNLIGNDGSILSRGAGPGP